MYDVRSRSIPNWEGTLAGLKEILQETLFSIEQDKLAGVLPEIAALQAFDMLDTYLVSIKSDLGV